MGAQDTIGYVIGVPLGLFVLGIFFEGFDILGMIFATDTSAWPATVEQMWVLFPMLALLGMIAVFLYNSAKHAND